MIETHLRTKIQPVFNFLGKSLIPLHITPNDITIASFIFGIAAGIAIAAHHLKIGLVFLLISGLGDILDGTVARLTNNSQVVGAYMDLISDRMVEASFIVGLTIVFPQHYLAYILFLVAVLLHFSTFVVAGSLFKNDGQKSLHYDKSFIERAEAFAFFTAMLLLPQYIFELLMLLNILIFGCAIRRFFRVLHYAKQL